MKTNTLSSKIIIICCLLFALIGIYKGYSISNNLVDRPQFKGDVWLIGSGPYFADTIKGNYKHIVSDFTLVELLPRIANEVQVDGYENGKDYVDINIQNDTLYINRLKADNDTSVVRVNDDYALRVQAGAADIQSITLSGAGSLSIPARPYGSDLDGKQVYKPEVWEKYVLLGEELDIYLNGESMSQIFTEVKKLNIYRNSRVTSSETTEVLYLSGRVTSIMTSGLRASPITLFGESDHLSIIGPRGAININGTSFKTDSLTVSSSNGVHAYDSGSISVQCSEYINADLKYDLDIFYMGSPEIEAKAIGYGRVIKKDKL